MNVKVITYHTKKKACLSWKFIFSAHNMLVSWCQIPTAPGQNKVTPAVLYLALILWFWCTRKCAVIQDAACVFHCL